MKQKSTILGLDSIGVLVSGVAIAASIWVIVGPVRAAGNRTDQIRDEIHTLKEHTGALEQVLDMKESTQDSLSSSLNNLGALRDEAWIEKDLTIVNQLADKHGITFTVVNPLKEIQYPGILEERFEMEGHGTFLDWIAFFKDFESCSIWADITTVTMRIPSTRGNLDILKSQAMKPTVKFELGLFSTSQKEKANGGSGK